MAPAINGSASLSTRTRREWRWARPNACACAGLGAADSGTAEPVSLPVDSIGRANTTISFGHCPWHRHVDRDADPFKQAQRRKIAKNVTVTLLWAKIQPP